MSISKYSIWWINIFFYYFNLIINFEPWYGTAGKIGDIIEVILDLTTFGTVSFVKNGVNMGIAFTGLKKFGKIHLGITMHQ